MRNVWKHFKTITHHRRLVRRGCFRVGLYWQGLTHDLSKYSPIEFWTGVRYYQGTRSPNTAEREAKAAEKAKRAEKFAAEAAKKAAEAPAAEAEVAETAETEAAAE